MATKDSAEINEPSGQPSTYLNNGMDKCMARVENGLVTVTEND